MAWPDAAKDMAGEVLALTHDVTSAEDWDRSSRPSGHLVGWTSLVNNAGIMLAALSNRRRSRTFGVQYRINVEGPFMGCRRYPFDEGERREHQARPSIINISSIYRSDRGRALCRLQRQQAVKREAHQGGGRRARDHRHPGEFDPPWPTATNLAPNTLPCATRREAMRRKR